MEFLEAISPGWVGSLIGILGLIGLVITYFLYRASRIGPRPVYKYQALRLIGESEQELPEDITILFRNKKLQRLTKTHIILWNSGKTILNGENIVADDPLRLEFSEDSEVLSARLLNFTRQANKFTVNIHPHYQNQVILSFDYLDVNDGAVIEILHTDRERYPKVHGVIRGVPKGILNWGRFVAGTHIIRVPFRDFRIMLIAMLFFGVCFTTYGFFKSIMPEILTKEFEYLRWVYAGGGLLWIFVSSRILWDSRRRFPKSLSIEAIEW